MNERCLIHCLWLARQTCRLVSASVWLSVLVTSNVERTGSVAIKYKCQYDNLRCFDRYIHSGELSSLCWMLVYKELRNSGVKAQIVNFTHGEGLFSYLSLMLQKFEGKWNRYSAAWSLRFPDRIDRTVSTRLFLSGWIEAPGFCFLQLVFY